MWVGDYKEPGTHVRSASDEGVAQEERAARAPERRRRVPSEGGERSETRRAPRAVAGKYTFSPYIGKKV